MTSTYRVDDQIIGKLFTTIISEEVNSQLTVPPSDEEILLVVRGMNSWKAPGPDGLNGSFLVFLECHWSIYLLIY